MSLTDLGIAGKTDSSTPAIVPLFAGEFPTTTAPDYIAQDAAVIPQYTPLTRDATSGLLKRATKGDKIAAVTSYAIDATAGQVYKTVYKAAYFNTDALAWPAAFDTDLSKVIACSGTTFFIRRITA